MLIREQRLLKDNWKVLDTRGPRKSLAYYFGLQILMNEENARAHSCIASICASAEKQKFLAAEKPKALGPAADPGPFETSDPDSLVYRHQRVWVDFVTVLPEP